jgi:hypothetical protein
MKSIWKVERKAEGGRLSASDPGFQKKPPSVSCSVIAWFVCPALILPVATFKSAVAGVAPTAYLKDSKGREQASPWIWILHHALSFKLPETNPHQL